MRDMKLRPKYIHVNALRRALRRQIMIINVVLNTLFVAAIVGMTYVMTNLFISAL